MHRCEIARTLKYRKEYYISVRLRGITLHLAPVAFMRTRFDSTGTILQSEDAILFYFIDIYLREKLKELFSRSGSPGFSEL